MLETNVAIGSPKEYADKLYWELMEFDNLDSDDIRKLGTSILNRLYCAVDDEKMKTYYRECLHFMNRRGGGQ